MDAINTVDQGASPAEAPIVDVNGLLALAEEVGDNVVQSAAADVRDAAARLRDALECQPERQAARARVRELSAGLADAQQVLARLEGPAGCVPAPARVPAQREPSELEAWEVGATAVQGTVKWFRADKGFGFITRPGAQDLYVHFSAIQAVGHRELFEGDEVEFDVVQGSMGPRADNVVVLSSTRW